MLGSPELLAIIERSAREQPRSLQTVDKLLIVRVPATECLFGNTPARNFRFHDPQLGRHLRMGYSKPHAAAVVSMVAHLPSRSPKHP